MRAAVSQYASPLVPVSFVAPPFVGYSVMTSPAPTRFVTKGLKLGIGRTLSLWTCLQHWR